jgi:hypothetical protein
VLLVTLRPRRCKQCKTQFNPRRQIDPFCGPKCSDSWADAKARKIEEKRARELRVSDKAAKLAIKPRSQWLKEAQAAFNAWVKKRDADLPCVSCGRHHTGQYHAGHFLSTGARPELRFEPLNVWKQCAPCNTHLSGNLILYRKQLIERIGVEKVEWLEGPHEPKKYTVAELIELKKVYTLKARELERQREKEQA